MRTRSDTRGMTLVELLAAMAIFLGLAGMVIQVLGGGLTLWSTGERTRDEAEQGGALLDRLCNELRHALAVDGGEGEPRVKMLCDFIALDADGDGTRDFRAQRLLFTRTLFEERTEALLRASGTTSGSSLRFTGRVDPARADLAATESRVEVAFLPQPDIRAGFEGRMVLWRALQSPIGGEGSLFLKATRDEGGLQGALLEPLAENVLWFGVSFIDDSVNDAALGPDDGGALVLWDSTRGILPIGEGYSGFRHARGPASLVDPDDDVFPDAVRLAVVVAPPPDEGPSAAITDEVPAAGGTVRVELQDGRYLAKLGAGPLEMKLGHEWIAATTTDGATLTIVKRGLHGTSATLHPAGSRILTGRRFERVVPLAAGRGDLASRDLPKRKR